MAVAVERSRKEKGTIPQFLLRRFKRIYPTFWCSIAVALAVPIIIEALSFLKTGVYAGLDRSTVSNGWLDYSLLDWIGTATLTKIFLTIPMQMDCKEHLIVSMPYIGPLPLRCSFTSSCRLRLCGKFRLLT